MGGFKNLKRLIHRFAKQPWNHQLKNPPKDHSQHSNEKVKLVGKTEEEDSPDKSRERGRKTCCAFDAVSVHGSVGFATMLLDLLLRQSGQHHHSDHGHRHPRIDEELRAFRKVHPFQTHSGIKPEEMDGDPYHVEDQEFPEGFRKQGDAVERESGENGGADDVDFGVDDLEQDSAMKSWRFFRFDPAQPASCQSYFQGQPEQVAEGTRHQHLSDIWD